MTPAPLVGKSDSEWPEVHTVTLPLCEDCLNGKGGECHTPGCALWMNRAPDIPVKLYAVEKRAIGSRTVERVSAPTDPTDVACPVCGAAPGEPCDREAGTKSWGSMTTPGWHVGRVEVDR